MGVCLYEIVTLFLCYCCCFTVLSFTCHLSFLFVKNKNYNLLTFYYPVIKKTFLSSNKTVFHIVILWSNQLMVHTGWGCGVLCVGPPGMLQLLVLLCDARRAEDPQSGDWQAHGYFLSLRCELCLFCLESDTPAMEGQVWLLQLTAVTADTGWARGASTRWLLSAICKHCWAGASTLWSEGSSPCLLMPGFLTV